MKRDKPTPTRARRTRTYAVIAIAAAVVCGIVLFRMSPRSAERSKDGRDAARESDQPKGAAQSLASARFRVGDVLMYTLSHEAAIDMAEGGRFYHLAASGDWTLRVVEVQQGRVQVAASLQNATLVSNQARPGQQQEYDDVERLLGEPMFFTLDAAGKVDEVRFEPRTSRAAIDLFRSVIALSQVALPDKHKAHWVQTESDATGKYLAEYQELNEASHLSKKKQRYTEVLASNAAINAEISVEVIASEGDLRLDAHGVLESLRVRDAVRTRTQLLPEMTSSTLLTLTRKGTSEDVATARALRERAAKLEGLALYEAPPALDDKVAIDRAKVAGRKLGDFVRDFAALPSLEEASFEQRDRSRRLFIELAALFRLDEGAVEQAMAIILSGSKLGPVLWDALASAGTPAAQTALRALIDNPRFDLEDRRTQMIGLSFVTAPTPETVDFLFTQVDDAEQGQQARFGIGTALNHLRGQDDERVARGIERLATLLKNAESAEEISDYLRAIGNAGVAQGKPLLPAYFEHDSPSVRAAAVNALRFMPGEDVVTTLREVLQRDDQGLVRASAIQAAGERAPDRALLEAVYQASISDAEKLVRDQATDTLSRWGSNYPPIGEALAAFKRAAAPLEPSGQHSEEQTEL